MNTNLLKQLRGRKVIRQRRCSECREDVNNAYQSGNGDIICPRCYVEIMSNVTTQD